MPWWVVALIALAFAVGVGRLLGSQPLGKKQTRYDFQHGIKSLIILKKNGGWLDIQHRGSPFHLRIYRQSGDDSSANVVVSVPLAPWSERRLPELTALFERQDLSHSAQRRDLANESSLVEVRLHAPQIWTTECGAAAARTAHLVLDLFEIGPGELFDLRLEGTSSQRWKQHRDELWRI